MTEPTEDQIKLKLNMRRTFPMRLRNHIHDFIGEDAKTRTVELLEIVGALEGVKAEILNTFITSSAKRN